MAEDRAAAIRNEAEWNRAYDEAVQWRDWQTCDQLLDERETARWYTEGNDRRWARTLLLMAKKAAGIRG